MSKLYSPSLIGWENIFQILETTKAPTYPPYNIIKVDDNSQRIEIAVAGFQRSEIEVELNNNELFITGKKVDKEKVYIHHGISNKDFKHKFVLADTVHVTKVELVDGLLNIHLENIIPESKKPKKLEIK